MLRDVIEGEVRNLLRFVKMSGPDNIGGPCPFHKDGMEKTASFFINLNNGLFLCHSCGRKGTFVQFLRALGASSRKIELVGELSKEKESPKPVKASDPKAKRILSEAVLGPLDYCPTSLIRDGFDKSLLRRLDIGYDKDIHRVTYPIRDLYGNLVGISGRTVIDALPRYLVYRPKELNRFAPSDDPHKYDNYAIKNHDYLWNMHNVYPSLFFADLDTVIVVEGYKACIWMIQQGFDNTVALMGSRMTVAQEALLTKFTGTIFLCLDFNEAGIKGTFDTGNRLIKKGQEVRVFNYPEVVEDGAQPDSLDRDEIKEGLDTASQFISWRIANGLRSKPTQFARPKNQWVRSEQRE